MMSVLLALAAATLAFLWAFHRLGRVSPEPSDLAFLEEKNLHALYVLKIIDSADYRHYAARSPRYRQYLFQSYARNLKQDVAELSELPTDFVGLCHRLLFGLLYGLLMAKSRLAVGQSDLRVLLGAELMFSRRLRG